MKGKGCVPERGLRHGSIALRLISAGAGVAAVVVLFELCITAAAANPRDGIEAFGAALRRALMAVRESIALVGRKGREEEKKKKKMRGFSCVGCRR